MAIPPGFAASLKFLIKKRSFMLPFALTNPPPSLLYVEDDAIARGLTGKALCENFPSLELYSAGNGEEGFELYRKHRPDVVLTDINLPDMDGIRMAHEILDLDTGAHIILVSGHSDLSYLLDAIKMGVRRYVLKPLDHEMLFDAVSDCLSRVALQRQVRQQEQYIHLLSQVVEQKSSPIAIADGNGDITYVNSRFCEFTGYSSEEMLGRNLRQLRADDAETPAFGEVWNRINAGIEWHGEGMNQKKCGESYREVVTIAPLRDKEGGISHFVTVRKDVTAKRQRQDEMDRVQKLESLGVLAGGIAHDFNNILTGILGNISLAQAMISDTDQLKKPLEDAESAAHRAAALTRQLLTFARGGKPVKKLVSVAQLVDEALSLALSGSNVRRLVDIAEHIHAVEVDAGQIAQAFNNILINAVQAMPQGGTVAVKAENVSLGECNGLELFPGDYVRISFADQGGGIPAKEQKKIFDPYYSTKPVGSGLGLTSAHSIVTKHGGHIAVESSPGSGATFICHLPSTRDVFSAAREVFFGPGDKRGNVAPPPRAGGAVLVMDDEGVVRKIAGRMLECLGYQVTTCKSGEEAIELYKRGKESAAPFLAVIMDLTIAGGMGCKEAAEHILAMDPKARLVVSSGYFEDPVLADYREHGFCAIMPKPYKVADLAAVMSGLRNCVDLETDRATLRSGAPLA
jgi:two-component system, cell cycle sensor histidine kinase and response regulator CckA